MRLDANIFPFVFGSKLPVVNTCVGALVGLEELGLNVVIAPVVVTDTSVVTALAT